MILEDTLNGSSLANHYDSKAEEYGWRGPEVVFGLSYSFVNPRESVLDIGIGTGLGSVLFHKAGLHVYGMDVSTEMLDACRSKGFAADLKKHDLIVEPYAYGSYSFWVGPREPFDIVNEGPIDDMFFGLKTAFLNPKLPL